MKNFFGEFRKFIARGNVIDLAVAVVIGSAFGKIVTSLVDNILMPLIGLVSGGINISGLNVTVKDANIQYGLFLQNLIDFIIIAFCIFIIVKIVNKIIKKKEEQPKVDPNTKLLEEIRDLLKEKNSSKKEEIKKDKKETKK